MAKKQRKDDDLDMETTFADMNIEGFRWYDPNKKKNGGKVDKITVTKKEYRSMVKGAFQAFAPLFGVILFAFAFMVLIAYWWLF